MADLAAGSRYGADDGDGNSGILRLCVQLFERGGGGGGNNLRLFLFSSREILTGLETVARVSDDNFTRQLLPPPTISLPGNPILGAHSDLWPIGFDSIDPILGENFPRMQ